MEFSGLVLVVHYGSLREDLDFSCLLFLVTHYGFTEYGSSIEEETGITALWDLANRGLGILGGTFDEP
jgi:hypothetical protein